MTKLIPINVPERGRTPDLNPETWSKLERSDSFWQLVERHRIQVSHRGVNRVALVGTSYVGRAVFDDVSLEISEKVEGALASLLSFATQTAFKVDPAEAPATELGVLAALLVRQFLSRVIEYVSQGRDFRYALQPGVSSLVGGRIDLKNTISLRARGVRHLIAFNKNIVVRSTPKNRVLYASLREVENLAGLVPINPDDVATARGLAALFDDCCDAELLFGERANIAHLAEHLAKGCEGREACDRDLLALASIILSHESFEHSCHLDGTVPRAWFLNLEALFETSVRRVLRNLCEPEIDVGKGPKPKPLIFKKQRRRADPDLVLRRGKTVLAVGDVKYKDWAKGIKRSDLYQLLIHAAAFNSPLCFLIYPHHKFECVDLGKSATDCATYGFAVDVRDLPAGLKRASKEMGLPLPVERTEMQSHL